MGYNAPYVPGWDCHGLPIEWKVEEKYREKGLDKDEIDPLQFRSECREFAQKWVDIQSEEFQRLGVIGDWQSPYLTMTTKAEGYIVKEIHKFLEKGLLYKGVKPVMWSTIEKTALAEAEIEYQEHKSVTVWVKFPVKETHTPELKDVSIVIWTTTPWTLPSNRAIAYNEDFEYGLYEVSEVGEGSLSSEGDKILIAQSLSEATKEAAKITSWTHLKSYTGKDLDNTICHHPLHQHGYDFDVPLLKADFVTDDTGTGFVHIAPGHGADDFMLGQEHNLEVTDNVTDDGKFREIVPLFAGLEVYDEKGQLGKGNFAVLRELNEVKALLAKGNLKHEYPHSWRSKAPLIFRTTPQWFIAMDDEHNLRDTALKEIKNTRWVPSSGQRRIEAMIENRPDWCISRQRAWGVPIAIFINKKTGQPLLDSEVNSRISKIFEEEGSDSWWSRPAQDFLGNDYEVDDYEQIYDIVDVWFESGSTHAFVLNDQETWPVFDGVDKADLYLEGSDQHRGWFHSSLLESCGTTGTAPYNTVLTHGFVLDEKGYKMSKSLGNVVDPLKVIDQYGADILRLWTMLSDYSEDIRISQNSLKTTADIYRRLRNTLRFLLGALEGFTNAELIQENEYHTMPELERLMLHKLSITDKKIRQYISDFEFGKLSHLLHNFCNAELSAFYFDIRKDRLYCDHPELFERRACRTVLSIIFESLITWIAPLLSFTAEEVWSHKPKDIMAELPSVHLTTFPEIPASWEDQALDEKWSVITSVRKDILLAIEPLRASKELGSSLEAAPKITTDKKAADIVSSIDLSEVCITAPIEVEVGQHNIEINRAKGSKCVRCWKTLEEVSDNNDSLCNRCAKAVDELKNREAA
jgi:isoleucyl-tRNA synthetase